MTEEKVDTDVDPDEEEVTENIAPVHFYPTQVDGVPCVIMKFVRPVGHLVFDQDSLFDMMEAAIQAMESAENEEMIQA